MAQIIRDVSHRLREVVNEEAECHETICMIMGQLVSQPDATPPGLGELIEALQYFDRLQQRTGALCVLVENLAEGLCSNGDPRVITEEFCRTAPVERDANWLAARQ